MVDPGVEALVDFVCFDRSRHAPDRDPSAECVSTLKVLRVSLRVGPQWNFKPSALAYARSLRTLQCHLFPSLRSCSAGNRSGCKCLSSKLLSCSGREWRATFRLPPWHQLPLPCHIADLCNFRFLNEKFPKKGTYKHISGPDVRTK